MPQSLSSILIHLVFSTKNREPFITRAIETELHPYMAKIFREVKSGSDVNLCCWRKTRILDGVGIAAGGLCHGNFNQELIFPVAGYLGCRSSRGRLIFATRSRDLTQRIEPCLKKMDRLRSWEQRLSVSDDIVPTTVGAATHRALA
jgi:hypothetical protein